MSGNTSWNATVGTAIALQWAVVAGLAAAVWLVSSAIPARSLFFGGAAVALPNSVLALWLTLRVYKAGSAGAGSMLMGEILKLGLTIAMLAMIVVKLKPDLSWLALIFGVVAALKAQWLALWVTRQY